MGGRDSDDDEGGGALETLAGVRVLVIGKAGTLTHGTARLASAPTSPRSTKGRRCGWPLPWTKPPAIRSRGP